MPAAPTLVRAVSLPMWRALWRATLALILAVGGSDAAAQTSSAVAETLMRQSGLWAQLDQVAPQVRSGLVESLSGPRGLAPTELARLSRSVDVAYGAGRLRAAARSVIARETRHADVPALQAWFGSRVGRAITRIEEASAADEHNPQEIVAEGLARMESLPDARQALIRELVVVTRSAESLTTMTINTTLAIQAGVASATAPEGGPALRDLRDVLEGQRAQMDRTFASVALAAAALTYAEVTDDDLARYLAFLKSPAGAHFTEVGMRALDAALERAAGELGRAIPAAKDAANI